MREELNIKRYFSIHFEYWFKEIKSKPPISLVSNQYLMSFFFFFFGRSEMFHSQHAHVYFIQQLVFKNRSKIVQEHMEI